MNRRHSGDCVNCLVDRLFQSIGGCHDNFAIADSGGESLRRGALLIGRLELADERIKALGCDSLLFDEMLEVAHLSVVNPRDSKFLGGFANKDVRGLFRGNKLETVFGLLH